MDYTVEISQPARDDFIEYAAFIIEQEKSVVPAEKWVDGLLEATASLSEFPSRFPLVPESEEIGTRLRSMIYESHRIIYRIDESAKQVIVLRIYHGSRQPLTQSDITPED